MRTMLTLAALMCVALLATTDANFAQDKKTDKKEVVLKGLICCTKCELSVSTECATVIQVKSDKDKKGTLYYFDAASHKKYHDDICTGAMKGTVVGIVTEVDKKKVVSVKKLEYAK
jgi:hypothetical protein